MDILKLKYISVVSLFIATVLLSCTWPKMKSESDSDCKNFVAGKQGFWISIESNMPKDSNPKFRVNNRNLIPQKIARPGNRLTEFFLNSEIKLRDTLTIIYRDKTHKVYDFRNIREAAIDGLSHEKIDLCRVSTAKIDGIEIADAKNNILVIRLND